MLGPQRDVVQHMRALPHGEVASAIESVRSSKATTALKLAFEFLVLTAARSGEVRLATWDEIDTRGHVWTIPATRMKANRAHRVPLSERALEILAAARTLADGNPLVFPNRWGNCIKDTFLSQMLKDLEIPAVPHGFRSSFRDWAAEETDHPREVIEAALAHVVRNQTEGGLRSLRPVRASAAVDGRLGSVPCRRTPSAASHHGARGTRSRRKRRPVTMTEPEPASPERAHRPRG